MALFGFPYCNNSLISSSFAITQPFAFNQNIVFPISSFNKVANFMPQILIQKKPHFPRCLDSSVEPYYNENANCTTIIFLKGLAQSTSEGSLKVVFSQFGDVSRGALFFIKELLFKIITDKKSKQPLGFAYIWFPDKQSALSAVKEMNGKFLDGRFIQVQMAKPGSCKPNVKTAPFKF